MNLEEIFYQFDHTANYMSSILIKGGHINSTYHIITKGFAPDYVLQKINSRVFKNIPALIQNKVLVTNFLRQKTPTKHHKNIIEIIPCKSGRYYFIDKQNSFWNLMIFIPESVVYNKAKKSEIAGEAGSLFGGFFNLLNDFNVDHLEETIPHFHDLDFRFKQFEQALEEACLDRKVMSSDAIAFIKEFQNEMLVLHHLKTKRKLPLRATHNDTKLSNALFNKKGKGISVIDLDTLMPGLVHFDFGDSIRTICSSAEEDEKDVSRVCFLIEHFRAFSKGFLSACGNILTKEETNRLVLGAQYMVFIMALRFLTDFLNNDSYFKINYPQHNLVRAKNQMALFRDMVVYEAEMESIIYECAKNYTS